MHNRPPHEIFLVISLRKQNSRRSIAKGGASDLAFRIFPDTSHRQRERFKNKLMKDFCAKYKIKQVRGAPRTPQTQGLVERNNRTACQRKPIKYHERKQRRPLY